MFAVRQTVATEARPAPLSLLDRLWRYLLVPPLPSEFHPARPVEGALVLNVTLSSDVHPARPALTSESTFKVPSSAHLVLGYVCSLNRLSEFRIHLESVLVLNVTLSLEHLSSRPALTTDRRGALILPSLS